MRRTRAQTQQRRQEMAKTRAQAAAVSAPAAQPPSRAATAVKKEPQAEIKTELKAETQQPGDSEDDDEEEEEEKLTNSSGGMAEYERKRLENIQRNLEFMRSMGVSTAKIAARTAASVGTASKLAAPTQRGISTKRKPSAPVAPMRKSRRLEGKVAEELMLKDEKNPFTVEEPRSRRDEPTRFDANLDAEALNMDGSKLLAQIVGEYEEREQDLKVDASGVDTVSYSLSERDVVKAVEERVYSVAFLPRSDRVVVACGDKRGNISLWNADAAEDADDVVAMYRPHTLPVTQLHFLPTDATKLLSACFDGSVRQFDLKASKFTEVFATDDHTGITSMAVMPSQRDQFLLSGDDGHVWTLDLRQQPAKQTGYLVHEKKVQTVHQHPLIDFCFATASLDRTVCLWDSRKLSKTNSKPLVTMPHHRSVNCAYFSPDGSHLVTVGQDDYIHVYDTKDATHLHTDDVKPTLRIPHNNQTGRWLTKLHAAWDPKRPDEYVIGCMQQPRRIQIFKATRRSPIQELKSDYFNSVHSINVFHPTLNLIAGGNSSGRMCLWRGVTAE